MVTGDIDAERMTTTLTELRIDLPDHPGALAAVTRELAALGADVIEVAIHEVDGARAVDEIVVNAPNRVTRPVLAAAVAAAGAVLLSARTCEPRLDVVVAALTWAAETGDRARSASALKQGVEVVTGIAPAQLVSADLAETHEVTAAARRRGRPVVHRVDSVPEFVTGTHTGPRWLLAVPDRRDGDLVVVAVRPFSVRFTATELRRLAALLGCYQMLTRPSAPRAVWSRALASNA